MGDADAVMLEMLKGLRQDVVTIRDNHLAHIAEDIDKIQQEQILARSRDARCGLNRNPDGVMNHE